MGKPVNVLERFSLAGKVALPLATGGGAAHFLALDFALKPVLAALGARVVLAGVYATDAQLPKTEEGAYEPDAPTAARLAQARDDLVHALNRPTADAAPQAPARSSSALLRSVSGRATTRLEGIAR